MALLLSNATAGTTRGSSAPLIGVRAQVNDSTLQITPDGATRVQNVDIDPGQNVAAGDYLTVTFPDGVQLRGVITFWEPVRGFLPYDRLTIVGGLLPVASS